MKCIKDENHKVLFLEEDIKNRWMKYFDELFNDSCDNTIDFSDLNILQENRDICFHRRITKREVKDALRRIKCGNW